MMSDFMAATIIAISIMMVGLLIFSRSGVVKRPRDIFQTEQQVLTKAKAFTALRRTPAAITTLEVGLSAFPKSKAIKAKLNELKA